LSQLSLKEILGQEYDQVKVPESPAITAGGISIKSLLGEEAPINLPKTFSLQELKATTNPTTATTLGEPDLFAIKEEYGRPLIKEDIISDPRLVQIVRDSLSSRYQPASLAGQVGTVATGLAGGDIGGLSGRDYQSMDPEEVFETWQNYQRSFAGGQTITTANELVYGTKADDDTKAKLGAGYLLFDSMDNAIIGEGSWAEMGDAIWDYGKAAVWDPSTILSLGIGKALGHAGTKVAATTLRSTLIAGYQASLQKGLSKPAAKAAVGAAVKSAQYAIPDAAIAMGTDVAYQMQLIEVGAQEEYSKAQTALAAAGGLVIPALMTGAAGVKALRSTNEYFAGTKLDPSILNVSGKQALTQNAQALNRDIIVDHIDNQFGRVEGTSKNWLQWVDAKTKAKEGMELAGELENNLSTQNAFYKYLWFGDAENNQKGFYEVLKDAGFRVTPSMKEEFGVAGTFGQALKFLSDEQADKVLTTFEKGAGVDLGITKTSEGLSSHFIHNATTAGQANWINSHLSRLETLSKNPRELVEALAAGKAGDADDPQRAQFALSVYKRLLTSSLSTTGTNIKGFGISTAYNTASDVAISAINLGQSAYYKLLKGDEEQAVRFLNRSQGSLLGALRRGASVLSPDVEVGYAEAILDMAPEYREKLFRDIAADGGVREAFKDFNLDKQSKLWKGADELTKGAQTVTFVRIQDELTKLWAFGNNVDQALIREYGVTPNEFFKRPDAALEFASDRFKNNVLEKATFRTMKETASINWTTLPATGAMRGMAKGVSKISNNPISGYVLPFGNFMNTNLAVIGDLTGVNAIRFLAKKAGGKELDFVTEEGAEALGKAVVGWSAIAMAYHGVGQVMGAKEKVEQGYTYNQHFKPDGSIEDTQYDGFNAGIQVVAQAIAHGLDGRPLSELATIATSPTEVSEFMGRIPADVWAQIGVQTGGQVVRDVDDLTRSVMSAANALTNGDLKEIGEIVSAFPARIFQGVTRPLEPIDQLYGLLTDKNMNPDLRQGPGKLYEALRYMDNITGISEKLPVRATPTEGPLRGTDVGKQILGVRGLNEPVLYERMLNATGVSKWNAANFRVPPEVKNTMDAMAAPLFEYYAKQALRANPNFFSMSQESKEQAIAQIKERVATTVVDQMKGGAVPKSLDLFRVLSGKNKGKVSKVLDFIGEGSLEEVLKKDDAYETLKKVDFLLQEYDTIFRGEFKLD
jgi:hypothetical protein